MPPVLVHGRQAADDYLDLDTRCPLAGRLYPFDDGSQRSKYLPTGGQASTVYAGMDASRLYDTLTAASTGSGGFRSPARERNPPRGEFRGNIPADKKVYEAKISIEMGDVSLM